GAADVLELVEIELVHQHAFVGPVHLLDLFAELVGDERGTVEGDVVTVLLLGTNAVAGYQRHQVGAGVALLDTLPVVARGDVRVMRVAAGGGGVEQQFGSNQRDAAGSFRDPLVPADGYADLRIAGVPALEAAVAGVEVVLLMIAGAVR